MKILAIADLKEFFLQFFGQFRLGAELFFSYWPNLAQLGLLAAFGFMAFLGRNYIKNLSDRRLQTLNSQSFKKFFWQAIQRHPFWFLWFSLLIIDLFLSLPLVIFTDFSGNILFLASIIASWWLLHRLVKEMAPKRWIPRLVLFIIFFLFLLQFSGILQPVSDFLESISFNPGNLNFSLLFLVKAIVWLIVALGITSLCMEIIERRLRSAHAISPSAQVLLVKILRVVFYAVALLIVMGGLGINLTALTVFSGAIGVGIGFGLQRVFANLISGLILLMDKSIKPGDVIEVGNNFGTITALAGRYVAVRTNSGKEILIPNEDLITRPVINWTFTDDRLRVEIPFLVSGKSDLMEAKELAIAAATNRRILQVPKPDCLITDFGEKGVQMMLQFWIGDPQNGISNIRGEVMMNIWQRYQKAKVFFVFNEISQNTTSSAPA